jgi:hypothetical protein
MWLNPGRWLLYGAFVAALTLGIYTLDQSRQSIGYDRAVAEYTAQALKATEAARAKEQVLQIKVTKVANDYQAEKRRRVADAVLNADRLRNLQAALGPGTDTAPTSGTDDPRDAVINQCASSLVILDGDFKSLAAQASSLQSYASNVCVSQ